MDAVPVGWKRGSMRSSSTLEEYQQTQGVSFSCVSLLCRVIMRY